MKKGVTLIEVVIASALILLNITLVSSVFIKEFRNYNIYMELHKEELSMNEALNFIESEIKLLKGQITVKGNEIIIEYDISKKKIINKKGEMLRISTNKNNNETNEGNNNILPYAVKDFNVILKNKLMYIKILSMKGNKYDKCIKI